MALDFAQIDSNGTVTGHTVRLDPRAHLSIIHNLASGEFPMLHRMREYYEDVHYSHSELELLEDELRRRLLCDLSETDRALVKKMLDLVVDSMGSGFRVEAIAD